MYLIIQLRNIDGQYLFEMYLNSGGFDGALS